jgi:hypothetical protein
LMEYFMPDHNPKMQTRNLVRTTKKSPLLRPPAAVKEPDGSSPV